MVRRGPVVVLLLMAAALIWAQFAVAALTLCLNESPALAPELAQSLPFTSSIATLLLPLFSPLGAGSSSASSAVSPPTSPSTAPPPPGAASASPPDAGSPPVGPSASSSSVPPQGAASASAASPACDPAAQARATAVAALAYAITIAVLEFASIPRRLAWITVLTSAAIARLALFFTPALLSSDIIDYATHGRVASLHAATPYVFTPSQFPSDPLSSLGAWPKVVTVYGPLWTRIDATLTGLMANATLVQLVFAYKLIGLAADVSCAVLIFWIARRWRRLGATAVTPLVAVAMWVLNPLVNIELVGNAHNEALMLALVLLGLACLTLAIERSPRSWFWLAAVVSFWLGALVKFVPLALEAIVAVVWLKRMTAPPHPTSPPPAPPLTASSQTAPPLTAPSQTAPPLTAPSQTAPPLTAPSQAAPPLAAPRQPARPFAASRQPAPPRAASPQPAPRRARFALAPRSGLSAIALPLALVAVTLTALTLLVAAPWLDSPAVAAPIVGLANGGQRFKDVWQDAPAAWLTVRVVPLLGVPDDPATLRMDVARVMVWTVTRIAFAAYLVLEAWHLWRAAAAPPARILRGIATASVRLLLLALLLYTSQVYAWYFLWPLPVACLVGPRDFWSRAAVVFGLAFLPAFYLREFDSYGVFEVPRYAEIALALLAALWLATRLRPQPLAPGALSPSKAVHP
jgi:hypothetical protein